ncbi:MAG TPA: hypothetical protein VFU05_04740 [Cyclobacteriaceae bacterium]|nr:hypothetical protein [Cyclobacteriaceae bacterium]
MAKKFRTLLFAGFMLHLLLLFFFSVWPNFLPETRFSIIYKTYLLPGPFFRDDRITTSYNLTISWKQNDQWSEPFNRAHQYFIKYYSNSNPRDLYVSRYLRANDQMIFFNAISNHEKLPEFPVFSQAFLPSVPTDADSLRVVITRKVAQNFSVRTDTVFNSIEPE